MSTYAGVTNFKKTVRFLAHPVYIVRVTLGIFEKCVELGNEIAATPPPGQS